MRKLISATMAGVLLAGSSMALVGCSDETSEKKQTTIKTPSGTTKVTEETKVNTSGQNPPPAKVP